MIRYRLQIADWKITGVIPVCRHLFEINSENTKTTFVGIELVCLLLTLNKCLSTGVSTFSDIIACQ